MAFAAAPKKCRRFERRGVVAGEKPQEGLMHQVGGLQTLARLLSCKSTASELTQLLIYDPDQTFLCVWFSGPERSQDLSDFVL
jgi:hypothetical protein